jgi:REP element-mobilizing transposase RayT
VGHTFANLLVHAIFSTKDRLPLVASAWRPRLYEYLAGIARQECGPLLKVGGVDNHLHLLLALRTDISAAEAIRKIKSVSSKWVNEERLASRRFAWQAGYGAFSVSASNRDRVSKYIESQEEHHRQHTFEEEFISFLERHGVPYDAQHVWD